MKMAVAVIERTDSRAMPQIPWPEVQPPPSRVPKPALPHNEGIAYKPPCGEIAVCPRVGRMGPIK
jgi:hypothetical protein